MATQQGMNGVDVCAMIAELRGILPLWVDKVYQFDGKIIGIRLNGEGHARHRFLIEPGRRAHLTRTLPEPPKNPPPFAMLLRKYLSGGKVLATKQHGLQRIFWFEIGKGEHSYHLVVELFDEGNIILTDREFRIIKPLTHHRFKDRDVIPDAAYAFSGRSAVRPTLEEFTTFLKGEQRDLVRALAVGFMLGGTYAEFICREAGADKSMPASGADAGKLYNAYCALIDRIEHGRDPVITRSGCHPFTFGNEEILRQFTRFNEALEAYFPTEVARPVKKASKPKPAKEEVIRRHQEEALKKFGQRIARCERQVAAIYENYQTVAEIIKTLDAASRSRSWQEIEKILRADRKGPAGKITAVFPADAAVEIDLAEKVKIFVHETVEGNLSRYYDEMKKFKRKKEGALAAMQREVPRRSPKKAQITPMKKHWYHRFRWFVTSDGALVLGGRNADQNEELVKKYMEGGDTFVHADVHGASVVVVKGKTEKMDEVVQFAASYSGAWRSGHFSADVYAAKPGQVSKTPESGEFVSRGSFIVRGERTYFRDVPLGIAIGLQLAGEATVIGGPPSAVVNRAIVRVGLKPGQFEQNDVAKKVLRIIREQLSEEEKKALKPVLNTEAVAACVPPGGSDIMVENES
jgi:predicted ribosome quality control (RQC) complex YloA/Tae2 family protein